MSKKNNYTVFYRRFGNDGIRKIVEEYAYKDDTVTYDVISNTYMISEDAISKCIEKAIINFICSYQTAILCKKKAHRNQAKHSITGPMCTTSDSKYDILFRKRLKNVKELPLEKVIQAVTSYINNTNLSCRQIANDLGYSTEELNILLEKAIIFNLVDDKTVNQLKEISKQKGGNSTALKKIEELRSEYIYATSEKDRLETLIQNYIKEFPFKDGISIKDLEDRKKEMESRIQNVEYYFYIDDESE